MTLTNEELRKLRDEAGAAGDEETVYLCDMALSPESGVIVSAGVKAIALRQCGEIIDYARGRAAE